jgi:hypothetical protein
MDRNTCPHANVVPEVCDQTLGVACNDCNTLLGVCWMDDHVSEKLWNRACKNADPVEWGDVKPCEQDRDDFCFLCGEQFSARDAQKEADLGSLVDDPDAVADWEKKHPA